MKSATITINTAGEGSQSALNMCEQVGNDCGLDRKQLLRLRLISEELFGMTRSIAGDFNAEYWIVYEKKSFAVHLCAEVNLSKEMYEEFIAASTSRKNAAVTGFMSRLRNMIAVNLLPQSSPSPLMLGLMNIGSMSYGNNLDYTWSMNQYRTELLNVPDDNDAEEAKDELEKSIIANIADEIEVRIVGRKAEIIVFKAF